MRNLYKTGLMTAFLLCLSINTGYAQIGASVGLDAEVIRMSDLEKMENRIFTPAKAWVHTVATSPIAIPNGEAMQDDQLIGGGVIYGTEIEKLGLQFTYFYFLTAVLAVGGDFTFFFPEKFEAFGFEATTTLLAVNILAHYIFFTNEILRAYGIGGLNLSIFRSKVTSGGESQSDSTSELGLNIGAGIAYALAAGLIYLELTYIIGDFDQLGIALGYRHNLSR